MRPLQLWEKRTFQGIMLGELLFVNSGHCSFSVSSDFDRGVTQKYAL